MRTTLRAEQQGCSISDFLTSEQTGLKGASGHAWNQQTVSSFILGRIWSSAYVISLVRDAPRLRFLSCPFSDSKSSTLTLRPECMFSIIIAITCLLQKWPGWKGKKTTELQFRLLSVEPNVERWLKDPMVMPFQRWTINPASPLSQ